MVDLFVDHVLVKNNKDQDELDTEREITMRLQNRILMLFFASAACESCQEFAPTLNDFFKHLTDEFYVDRAAQLVLLYIRYNRHSDTFIPTTPKPKLNPVNYMPTHASHPYQPYINPLVALGNDKDQ